MVGDWPLVLLISPSRSLPWIGIDWYDNPNQFLCCLTLFFETGTFCGGIKCGSITFATLETSSHIHMYILNFVKKVRFTNCIQLCECEVTVLVHVTCLGLDK